MQREDANNNNLEPFGTYKQLVALEELPLPEQPLKQEKRSIGLKGGASARQIYQVNYKKSQQLQLSKGNSTKMKLTKIFSNLRGQLSGQQSLEAKQTEKEQDTAVRGRNILFHTFRICKSIHLEIWHSVSLSQNDLAFPQPIIIQVRLL